MSDNGVQYISDSFESFLTDHNIQHVLSSPYNPRCNGLAKRLNPPIVDVLRTNRGKPLKKLSALIRQKLNYSHNRGMKLSPYESLFAVSPFNFLQRKLTARLNESRSLDQAIKQRQEAVTNAKRKLTTIAPKTQAYVKTQHTDKLGSKWKGPFKVTNLTRDGRVKLENGPRRFHQNLRSVRFVERGEDVVEQAKQIRAVNFRV